jgi:predicted nucleic acid-binding protein
VPAVLVDTGPLVALLDRSDPYHLSCQETFSSLNDTLVTVWPVVTEAIYMLRAYWQAQDALWEMIQSGAVQIVSLGIDDIPRMRELMRKYRDLPMDLADAGLVRVAERERLRRIFTLDRRDFQVYRPSRIGRFAILPAR